MSALPVPEMLAQNGQREVHLQTCRLSYGSAVSKQSKGNSLREKTTRELKRKDGPAPMHGDEVKQMLRGINALNRRSHFRLLPPQAMLVSSNAVVLSIAPVVAIHLWIQCP